MPFPHWILPSQMTRTTFTFIAVTAVTTIASIGYLGYTQYRLATTVPGPGLHRSNAVRHGHRRRRSRSHFDEARDTDDVQVNGADVVDNNANPETLRVLNDGETVIDPDEPQDGQDGSDEWWNDPSMMPHHPQRAGQNIVGLLFRVSEDNARRNACVHRGCACNACGTVPIRGIRYRCANCADFDLCESCEALGLHNKTHIFYKIRVPAPPCGPRSMQPVWYPGDPEQCPRNLPKPLIHKLSRETGYERPELEAFWEQWTFMANTEWRDDPDDLFLAMDRKTFERCLAPSGGYKHAAPNLIHDRMFAFYDSNHDDLIGFSEFLHGLSYRKRKDKLHKIFNGYDIDGDGYVNRRDFLRMFRAYYVLYKQMHRDILEGLDDQVMSSTEAQQLVTGRQPLSSLFGREGRVPPGDQIRGLDGLEGKERVNGEMRVTDTNNRAVNEDSQDTAPRDDILSSLFNRDNTAHQQHRFGIQARARRDSNPNYWEGLIDAPQRLTDLPHFLIGESRQLQGIFNQIGSAAGDADGDGDNDSYVSSVDPDEENRRGQENSQPASNGADATAPDAAASGAAAPAPDVPVAVVVEASNSAEESSTSPATNGQEITPAPAETTPTTNGGVDSGVGESSADEAAAFTPNPVPEPPAVAGSSTSGLTPAPRITPRVETLTEQDHRRRERMHEMLEHVDKIDRKKRAAARRQLHERWKRRQFYLDEEEGGHAPEGWDSDEDVMDAHIDSEESSGPVGAGGGESWKSGATQRPATAMSPRSRSSSKVRFAEDTPGDDGEYPDFETRSNPSTSSRSVVPERWGGFEIPEAEKDAGKEILYQVTQQAFNELLDVIFSEKENLAVLASVTKKERRVWRHVFEKMDVGKGEGGANKGKDEDRDGGVEGSGTGRNGESDEVTGEVFAADVEARSGEEKELEELLSVSGYTVSLPGDVGDRNIEDVVLMEEQKDEDDLDSDSDSDGDEDEDDEEPTQQADPSPQQEPRPSILSSPSPIDADDPLRDPTMPQFRPNAVADIRPQAHFAPEAVVVSTDGASYSAAVIPGSPPKMGRSANSGASSDSFAETTSEDEAEAESDKAGKKEGRKNSILKSSTNGQSSSKPDANSKTKSKDKSKSKEKGKDKGKAKAKAKAKAKTTLPPNWPTLTPTPTPPTRSRLLELRRLDAAEKEARERGGWGRLTFQEFEAVYKGQELKGNRLDYLGSWIDFCIP